MKKTLAIAVLVFFLLVPPLAFATAWNISSFVPDSTLTISSQTSSSRGIAFNSDGTELFNLGDAPSTIYKYDLSIPWDVGSASYSGTSEATSVGDARGLSFSPDGAKYYFGSRNSFNGIFEYTMSTPWDITTATSTASFSMVSQIGDVRGTCFNSDGTKLYGVKSGSVIYEYDLSTGWDVTTASYSGNSLSMSTQDGNMHGCAIGNSDGNLYVVGRNNTRMYEYTLGTGGSLSGASYSGNSLDVSGQESDPFSVTFGDGGLRAYVGANDGTNYPIAGYVAN